MGHSHPNSAHGLTLIDLLRMLGIGAVAAVPALWAWHLSRNVWITATTFVVGVGAILAFVTLWEFLDERLNPRLPMCHRGQCRGWQFETVRYVITKTYAGAPMLRCRCGDEYIWLRRRLMRISPDGKRWLPFRKEERHAAWVVDDNVEEPAEYADGTGPESDQ